MATRRTAAAPPPATDDGDAPGDWRVPVGTRNELAAIDAAAETEAENRAEEMAIGERVRLLLANSPGDRVTLKLYRVDPKSRTLPWCCDYTPEEFARGDLEMVRNHWGPGEYEMRVIGSTGIVAKPRFQIATPYALINPQAAQPREAPQSELAQVLAAIAQQNAQIMQMIANPPRPAESQLSTLDMLRAAKELFTPPVSTTSTAPDPLASITQLAGAMRAMREVAGEFNPPNDPDNPMALAAPLIGMIGDAIRGRQNPIDNHAPLPAIETPASLGEQTTQSAQDDQTMRNIVNGAVAKLCDMARANAPANDGGEFIYRALPPDLIPYLEFPNWFEILASMAPALHEHRVWIEAAKAHADTLFAADDDPV